MKRFPILLILLALCIGPVSAKEVSITVKRTVLQAAQEFDNIVVKGDITVECRFNPQYSGYIVYHNNDGNNYLACRNEGSRLIIDGTDFKSRLLSRVVVFCSDSLNAITVNDNGTLLIRRTPKLEKLQISANGSAVVKARTIEAGEFDLVNSGDGSIKMAEVNSGQLSVINAGAGEIGIKKGKADNAELVVSESGSVDLSGVKCDKVDAKISGDGDIRCYSKSEINAELLGGGLLLYKASSKVKKSITGNLENALGNK